MVRLRSKDITAIKECALQTFGEETRVFIFGSRADPSQKGGDIDILLEVSREASLEDRLRFLRCLRKRGIERKIDLLVKTPAEEEKPIYREAREKGVEI